MSNQVDETIRPDEYQSWVAVAEIENDRYCQKCGYNLRTHAVRRQPGTDLLVARCPECAAFASVSEPGSALRPWTRRLAGLAIFSWLVVLLALVGSAVAGSLANHMISLEARTTHVRVAGGNVNTNTGGGVQVMTATNGQTVTIPAFPQMRWQKQIITNMREYWLVKFVTLGVAALIVLVVATIFLAAVPHWPRLAYLLAFALVPAIPAVIAWMIWREDQPDFVDWASVQILHTWLAQVAAGVLAAYLGRAPLRLLATVFLPGRLRAPLAYLWLVDGRTPPKTS